jgi:beta-lactamase superfamily II metal-dependent hydrolase
MNLTMFQSGKGDCLLLSDGRSNVLVDGGMPDAYRAHVGPALGELRKKKQRIDLVYVSHIDQDHIGGVLRMLDDEVAWRVHEYQVRNGNPKHKSPRVPRPPELRKIWHNAFHEQLKKNAGAIEEALAAAAPVLSGAAVETLRQAGVKQQELATSIREAIQVSRRIGANQLGIPLNPESGGKLMMRRDGQPPTTIGGMKITILGPTEKDLGRLRRDWNEWLRKNREGLQSIRETARRDEERLGASELDRLMRALALQVEVFGDPQSVTPPNLASLTLLVQDGKQSILLTGDARGDQVLEGLIAANYVTKGGSCTVDVLKVPHHGSENNVDRAFCDAIVATDYIFCGNGEHDNPDLRVVELMARRRLAADSASTFKFWFNSSERVSEKASAAAHMKEVEKLVRQLGKSSGSRMKFKFLDKGSTLSVV